MAFAFFQPLMGLDGAERTSNSNQMASRKPDSVHAAMETYLRCSEKWRPSTPHARDPVYIFGEVMVVNTACSVQRSCLDF